MLNHNVSFPNLRKDSEYVTLLPLTKYFPGRTLATLNWSGEISAPLTLSGDLWGYNTQSYNSQWFTKVCPPPQSVDWFTLLQGHGERKIKMISNFFDQIVIHVGYCAFSVRTYNDNLGEIREIMDILLNHWMDTMLNVLTL